MPLTDLEKDFGSSKLEKDFPAPAKAAPATSGDNLSPLVGGTLDTFGLTDRPGKRTVKDVLLKPEGLLERGAQAAVTAPAIYLGGRGAGAVSAAAGLAPEVAAWAPVVGRMLTSGSIGAAEAKAAGQDPTLGALLNMAVAGLTEGAVSKVSSGGKLPLVGKIRGLEEMGAPVRELEEGKRLPGEVLKAIQARLPKKAFLNVPSLSKTPLTAKEAVEKLVEQRGPAYEKAYKEVLDEINRLDIKQMVGQGGQFVKIPGATAAEQFKAGTKDTLTDPSWGAKFAEGARGVVTSDLARSVADAITTDPVFGMPAGAIAGAAALDAAGKIPAGIHHLATGGR